MARSRPTSGDDNARELNKREERLFKAKANLDGLWQELAYNYRPWRADFTTRRALGEEYCEDIFDSTPITFSRDLGNLRASMLRPRGQEWFRATLENKELAEQSEVAQKLDQVNQIARTKIYERRSGFVEAMKSVDGDVVTFGNAVHSCEPTFRGPRPGLLYKAWHLRDCVWLDDYDGVTQDYLARRFKASARHIMTEFKGADFDPAIKQAADDDSDKEFPLCHTVLLADEYDSYKKQPARMPWISVYYDTTHKRILREKALPHFPYRVSRWERIAGSQYAISPAALTALPDARGLQTITRVIMEAGEKALDPPLKATQGAVLGEINNFGGGITWVKADYDERLGPAMESLAPKTNPPSGIELRQMIVEALRDEWYLNKLNLPSQAKTAYETAQLVQEFIRAAIPLFEPWEADTEAMLDGTFDVLLDIQAFGPLQEWPQAFAGRELVFHFSNPLQEAIEKARSHQATEAFGLIAAGKQADPQMQNVTDNEKMLQDAIRGTGAPADWLIDLDAARQQRAQADAQMAQSGNIVNALGQAGQAADIVNKGAEAVQRLQSLNGVGAPGTPPPTGTPMGLPQ